MLRWQNKSSGKMLAPVLVVAQVALCSISNSASYPLLLNVYHSSTRRADQKCPDMLGRIIYLHMWRNQLHCSFVVCLSHHPHPHLIPARQSGISRPQLGHLVWDRQDRASIFSLPVFCTVPQLLA